MKFEDPIFGVVDVDPIEGAYLGSAPITVNQRTAPCDLYVSGEVARNVTFTTTASALLAGLNGLDLQARRALSSEVTGKKVISDFIEDHLEELTDQVVQKFGDLPADHHAFLHGLELCGVGIHSADEGGLSINLDYSMGKQYSDELLVVTFDESAHVIAITHES